MEINYFSITRQMKYAELDSFISIIFRNTAPTPQKTCLKQKQKSAYSVLRNNSRLLREPHAARRDSLSPNVLLMLQLVSRIPICVKEIH
jgi:hypothetical protein